MRNTLEFNSENFQIESKVISWMRFPLAMLVVFVHVPRTEGNLIEWVCSDAIASMAVPLFFVLSGFLYFINIDTESSPRDWYWRKTKSRLMSLGIPYLFWTLLPVLIFCIRKIVGMVIHHHGPGLLIDGLADMNFYAILWEAGNGGPENMVLWFIRDLITLSICTPFIWYFIKYCKWSSLVLILVASIFKIWIPAPGFSATSTLFYSIGAWCAIHRTSLFGICKQLFIPSVILTPIAIVLLKMGYIPLAVFNVVGIPLFVHTSYLLFNNQAKAPEIFATCSMFIYLTHCYIVESPKVWRLVHSIIPAAGFGEIVGYFFVPLMAIAILVPLNWILRKIAPKTMRLICGR